MFRFPFWEWEKDVEGRQVVPRLIQGVDEIRRLVAGLGEIVADGANSIPCLGSTKIKNPIHLDRGNMVRSGSRVLLQHVPSQVKASRNGCFSLPYQ
jgi:hypothetical protein